MTSRHDARPRRSALYIPAANARALDKARTLECDVLIFDLEDAVAPAAKAQARAQAAAAITAGGYGHRELVLRVNGLDTPWGYEDLSMAARCKPDTVLIPKIEGPEALRQAQRVLAVEGAPHDLPLWAMLETPLAFLQAQAIAAACPGRLAALVMGLSDLAKDLGCIATPDRLALLPSLGMGLLAARAHRLIALDGVHGDLVDSDGLQAACTQARILGFDGKTLIHPSQIDAANMAFAPSRAELEKARRIVAAHEQALAKGQGVALADGQLVEALHADIARRTLALDAALQARTAIA
jgi:citrate lyase subunit beta / citryl-CoA lyase